MNVPAIFGAVDCVLLPPSAKAWIWAATVPPPEEVAVPPTAIVTYSLPSTS